MASLEDSLIREPSTFSKEFLKRQGAIPVRWDTKSGNIIYEYTARRADEPLMFEIGRQREQTFRDAGGGTGKEADIDKFDVGRNAYTQLFVYDPDEGTIIGGYRYKKFRDIKGTLRFNLASARLFRFSREFKKDYASGVVELGRSYIITHHQASMKRERPVLPALWKGLGSVVARDDRLEYFFGKVTMYPDRTYPATRDLILHYLDKHFRDEKGLVMPRRSNGISMDRGYLDEFMGASGNAFRDLNKAINRMKSELTDEEKSLFTMGFPPLLKSYLKLVSFEPDKMPVFGWALNPHFGNVEEIGIMIRKDDINDADQEAYIRSYEEFRIPA